MNPKIKDWGSFSYIYMNLFQNGEMKGGRREGQRIKFVIIPSVIINNDVITLHPCRKWFSNTYKRISYDTATKEGNTYFQFSYVAEKILS